MKKNYNKHTIRANTVDPPKNRFSLLDKKKNI